MAAIRRVFAEHGATTLEIVRDPRLEDVIAPPLHFLLEHWNGLIREGALPNARQIDPFALRPALGHLLVIETVDGGRDFRYRLYGSVIARISGFDMTGQLVSKHRASTHVAELAVAVYRAVVQTRRPIFTSRQPAHAERTTVWHRIILPFVDDSDTVVRLLAATAAIGADGVMIRS
ncbi:MAG: PAS domain-containing protein [Acidobacteriota bacterium]